MTHSWAAAASAANSCIGAADLRTACATEELVHATWALTDVTAALAAIGLATLGAAVVAAIFSAGTYFLEAVPGIVVSLGGALNPMQGRTDSVQWPTGIQTKDLLLVRSEAEGITLRHMENEDLDEGGYEELSSSAARLLYIENVGRSVIVQAIIRFRVESRVVKKAVVESPDLVVPQTLVSFAEIGFSSIQSRERIPVKILQVARNAVTLEVIEVTRGTLNKERRRRIGRRVQFAAEPVEFEIG